MPVPQVPTPSSRPKTLLRLVALTLLVGLAHAALLGGLPSKLGLGGPNAAGESVSTSSFVTRMIAPEPPAVAELPATPTPVTVRAPVQKAKPVAVTTEPTTSTAADTPPDGTAPAIAPDLPNSAEPVVTAAVAPTAPATPSVDATSMDKMQLAAGKNSDPVKPNPPAPAAAPAPSTPVQLPPSIRLLFEGRGVEKDFIKYAGNGELLWLQSGTTYSSRLEITALFGLYRRIWTSKGSLDNSGLEPVRFGDKDKGPEVATHFQRDKGIISFSANNPDVPLQAGAQDKLSAFFQLSALMAGAPDRFAPGSTISFQAADAHNAEPWNFKIGAPEVLDLPGGATKAIKLAKVATAEYGQSIEVWLAPDMHYLPVRIRITEANGGVIDLLWRKTEKAE